MKRKSIMLIIGAVLLTTGLFGQSPAQAYDKWVEFTIVRITQPTTGSTVPKGKTITLKCVAALDIDVESCVSHPVQVSDTLTFTWSADGGYFTDDTTDTATWVAPNTTGEVTITVTASDETTAPIYDNFDTNRSHSITLNVVNPGIVYVDDILTGANNGTSWANAYRDLNYAIAQASPGSELWVAAGTYKPDGSLQENSISIEKDLTIYGGFAGIATETALHQRDWVANVTKLSGDIGTLNDASDNSDQVVVIRNCNVVLDGVTITRGNGWIDGAGIYIESAWPVTNCSPTIRNCTFTDNLCDGQDADGGGLSCWHASPTVVNCAFVSNTAGDDGGGAANKSNSNGKYINCAFHRNVAEGDDFKGDGGAVFNSASEGDPQACTLAFVNCVFANNTTQRYGGAVALQEETWPTSSTAAYLNCTFYGNTAGITGDVISSRDTGNVTTLKNCILWANNTDGGLDDIFNQGSSVNISHSDVQGCTPANGNINADPWFADATDPNGPDDRLLTFDDGLRIKFGSPCIDAADGNAKDSYTDAGANERDALGLKHIENRTVTDTGINSPTWYDMGAFEAAVEHAIFISVDGLAGMLLDDTELMGTVGNCPNMDQIRLHGMWTYNARCDYFNSETMPNHWAMLTGRPTAQVAGWANTSYHGCTYNSDYDNPTWTVHVRRTIQVWETDHYVDYYIGNPNLDYMPSVYDVVHDRSGTTAEYAGKDKFILHEWSYDLVDGRADQVTPPNDGRDKIDTFEWTGDNTDWNSSVLMPKFIASGKPEYPFNFTFLHFKGPDKVGHNTDPAKGGVGPWGSPDWDNMVKTVDTHLGTVMNMVKHAPNKEMYYNTVIVLTADHGGTGGGHGNPATQANYTIPFGVWGHLVPTGDAYTFSDGTRVNPQSARPTYLDSNKPIRHADGVDLALNLMGLPSIEGAVITGMGTGQ